VANHEIDNYIQEKREQFVAHRMVVKIGSSTIVEEKSRINVELINDIARQASVLFNTGVRIVIVSSGAVDSGNLLMRRSGKNKQSEKIEALFGQTELTSKWTTAFEKWGVIVGVHLISENDLEKAKEFLSDEVMNIGILVFNGYDAVNDSDEETRRKMVTTDNDKLAAFVSRSIYADTSVFLTDKDGVMDRDDKLIRYVDRLEDIREMIAQTGSGTGGMWGKCVEADNLAREGQRSIIANGRSQNVLLRIARGENLGTRFMKG
jgi:glutamate 5-kinase